MQKNTGEVDLTFTKRTEINKSLVKKPLKIDDGSEPPSPYLSRTPRPCPSKVTQVSPYLKSALGEHAKGMAVSKHLTRLDVSPDLLHSPGGTLYLILNKECDGAPLLNRIANASKIIVEPPCMNANNAESSSDIQKETSCKEYDTSSNESDSSRSCGTECSSHGYRLNGDISEIDSDNVETGFSVDMNKSCSSSDSNCPVSTGASSSLSNLSTNSSSLLSSEENEENKASQDRGNYALVSRNRKRLKNGEFYKVVPNTLNSLGMCNMSGTHDSASESSYNARRPTASSLDSSPSQFNCRGGGNNSLQLSEDYTSVASLTTGGSSAPSLVSSAKNSQNNNTEVSRCLTPNFASQGMVIAKSPSEGSNTDRINRRGPTERPMKKKVNKSLQREKEVHIETLPGFRGLDDIERLVNFVEGTESSANAKKGKRRDQRTKDKDTLIKSASLDENHLNYNAKRSSDTPSTTKPSKDLEKKSTQSSPSRDVLVSPIVSSQPKSSSEIKLNKGSESTISDRDEEKEGEFELVTKKKKSKKSITQREAEYFSRGKATEQSRREQTRARRNAGDRRKSVGSVPGSENSEGSDDDSVRSLPAGECTPKERVPKQCASSGGTPQTSYADIARMTDSHNKATSASHTSPPTGGSVAATRDGAPDSDNSPKTATTYVVQQTKSKTVKLKAANTNITTTECQHEKHGTSQIMSQEDCKVQRSDEGNSGAGRNKANQNVKITGVPNPQASGKSNCGPSGSVPYSSYGAKGSLTNHPLSARKGGPESNPNSSDKLSISSIIKGDENKVFSSNGEGIKVPIEDKTEFPDISASLPTKSIPFNDRNHRKINSNHNNEPRKPDNPNNVKSKENSSRGNSCEPVELSNKNLSCAEVVKKHDVITTPELPHDSALDKAAVKKDEVLSNSNKVKTQNVSAVNGDLEEEETNAKETGSRRKKDSVSSVGVSPSDDLAVVFCGGNFDKEVPVGGNVGFEFGFDVMSAMSGTSTQEPDQKTTEPVIMRSSSVPPSPEGEQENLQKESLEEPQNVSIPSVPEKLDSSSSKEKTKFVSQPRESLLGSYRGPNPNPQGLENRRSSQPHYNGPRHPRIMPSQGYRSHQRNGGIYLSQQQPQPPYTVHIQGPQSGGAIPQALQQQATMYGNPPHMGAPGQNYPAMLPGPYGHSPGPSMARGPVPVGHPNQPPFMMPPAVVYAVPPPPQLNSEEEALSSGMNSMNVVTSNPGVPMMPVNYRQPMSPVFYDPSGAIIQVPYGPMLTQLYLTPTNACPVPVTPLEVENWMNQQVQKSYTQGAQGQITFHRIGELM